MIWYPKIIQALEQKYAGAKCSGAVSINHNCSKVVATKSKGQITAKTVG